LNGSAGSVGTQHALTVPGADLLRKVIAASPGVEVPGGPAIPGLDGVGEIKAALAQVLELRSPYTLLGDVAALARLLGPFGAEWAQEAEWKRVRGYVLMPRDQAVPRPCTEQVRFDDAALSAGAVAMTCGSTAFLMALDPPRVVATEDPLLTGALHALFWALWQKAEGQPPIQAPTKLDHMKLPDLAPRSEWDIPDSVIDDVRRSQSATFLLNLEAVRRSFLRMRAILPGVRIHYSVKTNPDDRVLRLLHKLGSSFEAASYEEIELALQAGAQPQNINFSAPVKKGNDLRKAFVAGVRNYTIDSAAEARKIAEHAPGARCTVRMVTSAEKGAEIQLSTKFGIKAGEVMPLMRTVADLGLAPYGIGFHVGGQNEVSSAWQESLAEAHHVVAECRRQGHDVRLVNIGGGFPILIHPLVPDAEQIAPAFDGGPAALEYAAEPGRIIVGDAGKLITPVVGRTVRDRKSWLYVNASLFGTLQMMDRHGFYFPVTTDHVSLDMEEYVISSLSCDGSDIISRRTVLPQGIAEGNLLIFHFVGAYSAPVFNIPYGGVSAVDIRYLGCE
jgi:ornithine decarboxylase